MHFKGICNCINSRIFFSYFVLYMNYISVFPLFRNVDVPYRVLYLFNVFSAIFYYDNLLTDKYYKTNYLLHLT